LGTNSFVEVTTEGDFDQAFKTLVQARVAALFVEVDAFFTGRRAKFTALFELALICGVRRRFGSESPEPQRVLLQRCGER
jgi:hypothetical protein